MLSRTELHFETEYKFNTLPLYLAVYTFELKHNFKKCVCVKFKAS